MTSTSPLFIAQDQDMFVKYDVCFHDSKPSLVRTELSEVAADKSQYICQMKLNARPSELPAYLRYVTVINSVKSGLGQSSSYYFNVLLPLFKAFGIPHVCAATNTKDCVANHAQSFGTSGTVVLFGGDTTISEFVNGLSEAESPLELRIIVIPTGTGNALANSIGITSPVEAIKSIFLGDRTWKHLTSFPVTIPTMKPICTMVVFSFGLHAGLVGDSDTPEMRKLGNERFKIAAGALVERDPTYYATIPGIETNAHSYLLITSVKQLEPGFDISPLGAAPDGKKSYLIHIPKVPGQKVMEIMGKVYQEGAHIHCPEVTYRELKEGLVFSVPDQPESERRCCVDGRIIVAPPGDITIGPASFTWKGWNLLIWT